MLPIPIIQLFSYCYLDLINTIILPENKIQSLNLQANMRKLNIIAFVIVRIEVIFKSILWGWYNGL